MQSKNLSIHARRSMSASLAASSAMMCTVFLSQSSSRAHTAPRFFHSTSATCYPVPVIRAFPDLSNLMERSDAVVVGRITEVEPGEAVTRDTGGWMAAGHLKRATLKVQKVYKGAAEAFHDISILTVVFFVPGEDSGYQELKVGGPHLYFLKAAGELTFAEPFLLGVPVSETRPHLSIKPSSKAYLHAAAEAEMRQNIVSSDTPRVLLSLGFLDPKDRQALHLSRTLLAHSQVAEIRSDALRYRLRCHDLPVIDQVIELTKGGQAVPELIQELEVVADVISPRQVARLLALRGDVTKDQGWAIEYAAGEIVRQIAVEDLHRPDTSHFADVAMELLQTAKDKDARYSGLQLLSILRDDHGPGSGDFADAPEKYARDYAEWWNKTGKRRYSHQR